MGEGGVGGIGAASGLASEKEKLRKMNNRRPPTRAVSLPRRPRVAVTRRSDLALMSHLLVLATKSFSKLVNAAPAGAEQVYEKGAAALPCGGFDDRRCELERHRLRQDAVAQLFQLEAVFLL